MMENRSFDHFLGWLKVDWNTKLNGLQNGMSCPKDRDNPSKGSVPITRKGYDISPDDPLHCFNDIKYQINDGKMNGFVECSTNHNLSDYNVVSMFDSTNAPIINFLAKEFAVFDNWFCSLPGPTDPNRAFAMSATSNGMIENFNGSLWSQQSYFDYVRQNNRTFKAYYQHDPWAVMYYTDTHQPINSQHIYELDDYFYKDVAAGKLADFTWLQPRMTGIPTWQHPDASVIEGERLIKSVYEALRNGPQWNNTLFIITYDENGGFYDHVPPPDKGVPSPDDVIAHNGFKFDRLGIRVPTIAISPWIDQGIIVSEPFEDEKPTPTSQYDATSVLATSNKILGITSKPLTKRMGWANTFVGLLDRTTIRDCPKKLPDLPPQNPSLLLEIQRKRPLNDHLETQILFYCVMNFPQNPNCLSERLSVITDQGKASDWLIDQVDIFLKKIRLREKQLKF